MPWLLKESEVDREKLARVKQTASEFNFIPLGARIDGEWQTSNGNCLYKINDTGEFSMLMISEGQEKASITLLDQIVSDDSLIFDPITEKISINGVEKHYIDKDDFGDL